MRAAPASVRARAAVPTAKVPRHPCNRIRIRRSGDGQRPPAHRTARPRLTLQHPRAVQRIPAQGDAIPRRASRADTVCMATPGIEMRGRSQKGTLGGRGGTRRTLWLQSESWIGMEQLGQRGMPAAFSVHCRRHPAQKKDLQHGVSRLCCRGDQQTATLGIEPKTQRAERSG
eukprot:5645878-Prymnesium_polylepis.1